MNLQPLGNLELLPEPDEPNILTAIDQDAQGYAGNVYGVSDEEARKLRRIILPIKRLIWPWGALMFTVFVTFLIISWPVISPLLSQALPDSEWAFEETGIREMHNLGYFGTGIRVCMVDTGIDISHPDLEHLELAGFRDFYAEDHSNVRDIGSNLHGTLMSGILAANGSLVGAAPEISLSVAISLGPSGTSGQEGMVSQAIRWCRISQNADIISLSLGANPGERIDDRSETAIAVKEAIEDGIFVIAAAGNTGLDSSINDVSIPANVEGVISVAATNKKGSIWPDSAIASNIDQYSESERVFPNQKPEISAPGVRLLSTYSTSPNNPLYAYSSGTSDSTVLVTGALALLLQQYGDLIAGGDGVISYDELLRVKSSLALSTGTDIEGSGHDLQKGYGKLNVIAWGELIAIEFNPN
tara:strand:- start:484 stop:1725 length:1242 start_codon:yes stop_codon:yes gene_type:complete